MSEQLRLISGGEPPPWHIDDHTRQVGRRGLQKARQALGRSLAQEQAPAGQPPAAA